ncbi:cyclin family protein [Skeletonema marinoi]|uniref:Cyclin family protein n=1 Tax=Skeletonema marinoi TaxID=267567 RepID=A0AAD8YJ07_9STRA|nr:cyclin family protein [Skeletonema marinoi]
MKPTENLSRNTGAVADCLAAMIKRELTTKYSCFDAYLNPSDPNMITAGDRMKLVDWCYDIVDHCNFSRETVASAMEMTDRFLGMPSTSVHTARVSDEALVDPSKFQLLTIAALYTSIKISEKVAISSELFAEMCSHVYTVEEIEGMERILLIGLSWRCHAPTAHQVGMSILSLLLPYVDIPEETWGFLMDEMRYLTELAVRDYYFSTQHASTVALAAIFNIIMASAMEMVDRFLGMPSNSADAARVSDEALVDPSKFQLLTIAALYTSVKISEKVVISSDLFAEMCSHVHTVEEIEDMERTLLIGLSWRCHAPTAHQVGMSILSLLLPYVDIPEVTWGFLIDEMRYLTELAVRDYYFSTSTQRTSTIALAAIFNVINDASIKERRELLGAYLRVIMECFDFDHPNQIAAARSRLKFLANPKIRVQEDNGDERSLDEHALDNVVAGKHVSGAPLVSNHQFK